MANSRRSDRSKSSVDYASFAGGDAVDDDFASSTSAPPAPKRQKKESKPKKECRKKKSRTFSDSDSDELIEFKIDEPPKKAVNRKSIDEKVFDRDLQMAMELSKEVSGLEESEASADVASPKIVVHDNPVIKEIKESGKENEHPMPEPSHKEKVEKPVKSSCVQDDIGGIEVLEDDVVDPGAGGRQRRKAASKAAKKWTNSGDETDCSQDDSDEDFKGEDSDEEEEDEDFAMEDEAADSDFDAKPAKATKGKKEKVTSKPEKNPRQKPSPRVTKEKTSKAPSKSIVSKSIVTPKTVKSAPKTSSLKPFSSPSLTGNSSHSSLAAKKIGSTPTLGTRRMTGLSAGVGGSSTVSSLRSPSTNSLLSPSGGLRIGLSRNIRSKPLHANIKAPH